jgi:hypothetical protein
MSLVARKTLCIKVKVGVPTCQVAGSVQLQGIAYSLDDNGALTCSTAATPFRTTVARKAAALKARHAITGNCTTLVPGTNYALDYTNTRCVELPETNPVRALTAEEEARGRTCMTIKPYFSPLHGCRLI